MADETNPIIRKVEEYAIDGVGKVHVFTAINPLLATAQNEPVVVYEGFTVVGAPMPNGQIAKVPVDFAIEATSIEDAFKGFKEKASARFSEMVKEANDAAREQQTKIITPADMQGGYPRIS